MVCYLLIFISIFILRIDIYLSIYSHMVTPSQDVPISFLNGIYMYLQYRMHIFKKQTDFFFDFALSLLEHCIEKHSTCFLHKPAINLPLLFAFFYNFGTV